MKLLSDIVLCDSSYATKVMDTYYFLPRTVLKANGYVFDWVTKNLILELHLNASSNIRDYSVYTEEQEADLLKVFFPTLDVDEAFARFRSICLLSVSTIYKCYQIEIDTDSKPMNNLWCGMPYHIFRLYLGMYYDALVAAPDEVTFKSIWFPEHFADNVYYRLLSAYVHVALNTPGEIIMGTDLGDFLSTVQVGHKAWLRSLTGVNDTYRKRQSS